MEIKSNVKTKIYIISNAIAWGAICVGTALALRDTGYFNKILPVLGSGAVWFVIINPVTFRNK